MANVTLCGEKPGCRHLGDHASKKESGRNTVLFLMKYWTQFLFTKKYKAWKSLRRLCFRDFFFFPIKIKRIINNKHRKQNKTPEQNQSHKNSGYIEMSDILQIRSFFFAFIYNTLLKHLLTFSFSTVKT